MMNRSVRSSNARLNNFALSTAIAAGFLLVLPACGIPQLRSRSEERRCRKAIIWAIAGSMMP